MTVFIIQQKLFTIQKEKKKRKENPFRYIWQDNNKLSLNLAQDQKNGALSGDWAHYLSISDLQMSCWILYTYEVHPTSINK